MKNCHFLLKTFRYKITPLSKPYKNVFFHEYFIQYSLTLQNINKRVELSYDADISDREKTEERTSL